MNDKGKSSEPTTTSVPTVGNPKQHVARWHTAEERAAALLAKKQRRRAAHRIALRRSHAKG